MKLCFIYRDKRRKGKSIENIFEALSKYLLENFEVEIIKFFYNNDISIVRNVKRLRAIDADIFHMTGDVSFLILFILDKKIINTIHDIGHYKNLKGLKKYVYGLLWIFLPILFSNRNFAVSEYTKLDLSKKFKLSNVEVIPNFVNPIFSESAYIDDTNSRFKILHVGTAPNKNLNNLVKALKGLNVELIIVGKIPLKEQELLDDCDFLYRNYVDISNYEMLNLYIDSHLIAFISLHEGFGMPIIEANAVGRPILCSPVCSIPSVAKDSALYCNPNSIHDIHEKVKLLMESRSMRLKLIEKGKENVKRFTIERVSKCYWNHYKTFVT